MTDTHMELSEDEFDRQYPLVRNHMNPNASWAFGDENGCLFETYGEELEFVRSQPANTIWTLVDGDNENPCLLSGYHLVNRIGYLISTKTVPEGTMIVVCISD